MAGIPNEMPKSVEDVFNDYKGRRAGLIKALTTEFKTFHQQCDPAMDNLCLFALPDERWAVTIPVEQVPPEIPDPAIGINFVRDYMKPKDWLSLIALHSDSWLLSVSFFLAANYGFAKDARKKLFQMINKLPSILEAIRDFDIDLEENTTSTDESNSARLCKPQAKGIKITEPKQGDKGGEEEGASFCGACGDVYVDGEFWICCDFCEEWFHGTCVKITSAKAEHMKLYKCPKCSHKRFRR